MQIPFDFAIEELSELQPTVKMMFGCHAVYTEGKIVLILRDGRQPSEDNGVWVATVPEHHASLHAELPSLRSIKVFGPGVTGWQVLPATADDFESSVLRVCELIRSRDPRIGKVPKTRISRGLTGKRSSKSSKAAKKLKRSE